MSWGVVRGGEAAPYTYSVNIVVDLYASVACTLRRAVEASDECRVRVRLRVRVGVRVGVRVRIG